MGACPSVVCRRLSVPPGATHPRPTRDVVDVDIDLSDGKVTIGSDSPVDDATLRDAVEEAGYELAN